MSFDPEILALLMKHGADVNSANDEGITLLHIISEGRYVPLIVEYGADIEARDDQGRTPLLTAMEEFERDDVVAALLEAGADPNARADDGQTALSLAAEAHNRYCEELLREYGARD